MWTQRMSAKIIPVKHTETQETLKSLYYWPNFVSAAELKELGDARNGDVGEIFAKLAA